MRRLAILLTLGLILASGPRVAAYIAWRSGHPALAVRLRPSSARYRYALAYELLAKGDHRTALTHYCAVPFAPTLLRETDGELILSLVRLREPWPTCGELE